MKEDINFERLYYENYNIVVRICLGYLKGNESLAQDLAQEVFVKVWESLGGFKGNSKLSTWIYRITVNTCLLELRKKKYTSDKNIEDIAEINNTEVDARKENQLKKLHGCIQHLSVEKKALILLEMEDVPQKEIADILGLSHEVVRTRIHRIKNNLKKCILNGNI
ncbi:RNA polymerase sigma-70 factor (ECF subfamily) [Saonia flava]|uniref:RNA polymerase sigma factor n=1 Tax=Saonia flava TaxID=523696 RepID=A0A846R0S9_9FLAO|nr:sigma-70 family RNA polymerase sigma factor [Saonia flava]NJB71535.1 RNA polymerase sigma-70 factor (ECF subfamily) [Saonia flava]